MRQITEQILPAGFFRNDRMGLRREVGAEQ